ncbi:mechanosensitive ion channel domain-containing protein [Polaribacter filamentus]|nr:mechanosensitive ion channel domain-containing protein [Polaribacter filamentus]
MEGTGISFALKEVIGSFVGWLTFIFGDFYKTGDRVQLG